MRRPNIARRSIRLPSGHQFWSVQNLHRVRRPAVLFLDPLVFPPLCLGRRACHCRGCPIRVYHNGIPDDVISPLARSREPVDSRSPRLNGPGPSDSITWSLPKDSVSGGRMEQAPCLPHGLFLALLLLPLLRLCRCLFRLLHRLAKLFDRFDTRRFQAILRNIPPHRRVIQRVLQSSSLKHQEGVVFRSNFHPCMRWLWRGSLPRQIRRTPLLHTDPYLIVCCLDGSGTCIDRPAIDCRIRSLPRAFSHTSNQVPRVLIERQPISPTSGTLSLLLPGPYGSQTDHRSARPHPA